MAKFLSTFFVLVATLHCISSVNADSTQVFELNNDFSRNTFALSEVNHPATNPTAMYTDNLGYLVTGSLSQASIDNGMKILEQGGNAMDAALAVAISQTATTSGKYISYAGIMNLLYYEASSGEVHNMNANYNTVKNETNPETIPVASYRSGGPRNIVNGRTVLVPGFMKGVESAHKKFGSVPFARLFDHAISVAEDGIVWTHTDAGKFNQWKNVLIHYPETKAVFTKPDDSFYQQGDLFKQPALARTLKNVAQHGADYMYTGAWAEKFVNAVRAASGKMTMQDMKNYQALWPQPLHTTYHGYDIYTHGLPASGGMTLIENLNLAEVSGLSEKGYYAQSYQAMSDLYSIIALVLYLDYYPLRLSKTIGFDPSPQSRLSKTTAKKIRDYIRQHKTTKPGIVQDFQNDHSAAIVATDRWGNMVALIHSINTLDWGSNGLFVDGVSIPDSATFQQRTIARTDPGNRLEDPTNPGIAFKDGLPVLGFSCIGGGLRNQSFVTLLNVLDFHMSPEEAIEAPSIGRLSYEAKNLILSIEPGKFSADVITAAEKEGAYFKEDKSVIGGYWTGVLRDYNSNEIQATQVWLQ